MSINHVGQEGMTLLRYQGANAGTQQWPGLNGRTYVFGLSRPVGYVDSRDVEHMLTKYWDDGNNRSLFIIVLDDDASLDVAPDEAKQINPPVAMGGSATMPVVDSNHVFNSEEEFTEAGPTHDPSEYNVKELRVLVKSFPLDTLQAMLVAEQAGKNRPTALSAIEAAIKKIEEEAE